MSILMGLRRCIMLVPVPLHSQRLKERGYNQTEAIFKSWAQEEKLSWSPNCLLRIRSTTPQWQLNRSVSVRKI